MNILKSSYAKNDNGEIIGPITEEKYNNNDGTMVTVVCITYKHEEFIAQALDSFVMQKTNFKFKVFVGEDYGPDNTAQIVREYAEKYPDIIVPFIREKNMGAQRNLIDLCRRATSPYIAFCEGDDYWIDEYKLQKQFDFMEKNKLTKVCITKTRILAPDDWHLRDWYKEKKGNMIIPDSIPGYKSQGEFISPSYIININVAHTSTHFYRWNYDLVIPSWYYESIIGDITMLLLQLGNSSLGFVNQITSIYRINEGSIFFDKDRESNFLRTRLDYIFWMTNFKRYVAECIDNYPIESLENRIKVEVTNYLMVLVKRRDTKLIEEFFSTFHNAGMLALEAYVSFFNDSKMLTTSFTWEGYKLVVRNRYYRNLLRPYAFVVRKFDKIKNKIKEKTKKLISFGSYWTYSLVPKKKNLWCFSGFNKTNYMDNSKYLYEWVVEHHPEIEAYWLTMNDEVYRKLKEEGKPVLKMRTWDCIKKLSRASIAVTDHFVKSDYDNYSGFNNGTKVVQLWHGVGLKSIGDLKNTDVAGVMFSDDILVDENDGIISGIWKNILYLRYAHSRELFEKYFLLICPGKERVLQIANKWNISDEQCFFSGHPRNILLHQQRSKVIKILYAPTYRWDSSIELIMVEELINNFALIDRCMKEIGGCFVIRLHPHTWRDYSTKLRNAISRYQNIIFDNVKDVYQNLGTYSIVISDYSSITYDFVLLNRPVIFHCPDIETFTKKECNLNYDYNQYSPGPKTKTWEETMMSVKEYIVNPSKDNEWRCKVRDEFYDMSVNDENNSERIVQEIKRRLMF